MNKRTHKLLDPPILGYFLLWIFVQIFVSLGGYIDLAVSRFIPGYATEYTIFGMTQESASGIGVAIAALVAAGLFALWFRPDFKGCLRGGGLKAGLLMLLPFLLLHYVGSVVSWVTFGTGSVLIAFLRALAPGFGEEIAYRGLGVANYMRTIRSEKQIRTIFWLSSLFFGLIHLTNVLAGGDLLAVIVQAVYAIGVGMLFGAVYLRTGNLWPTILGHTSVDFMEFIRADVYSSGGLMMGLGIGDWITIVAGVFAAFWALRLMNAKYHPEILRLWSEKWSREPTASCAPESDPSALGE